MPKDAQRPGNQIINFTGTTRAMKRHETHIEYIPANQAYPVKKRGGIVIPIVSTIAGIGLLGGGWQVISHMGDKTAEVKTVTKEQLKEKPSEQQFIKLSDGTLVPVSDKSKRVTCATAKALNLTVKQQQELIKQFPAMDGDGDGQCG